MSLRCCGNDIENFWIASNVKQFGALDDIILFMKEKNKTGITYLIQLKHNDVAKTLTAEKFLQEKGDFSLRKYLDSCVGISKEVSNGNAKRKSIIRHLQRNPKMVYILFTNRKVGKISFLQPTSSVSDYINIDGYVCGFNLNELTPKELKVVVTPENRK